MNRLPERGPILLRKAREDCAVLRTLMAAPGSPSWGIGFHAQQAIEKAIKAVLAHHGIAFPHTYHLVVLSDLLRDHGLDQPPDAERFPLLTPFGAAWRYDNVPTPALDLTDRQSVLDTVLRTLEWADRAGAANAP